VFDREVITGASLPEGVLSMTFDDGPGMTVGDGLGPKTERVAAYLAEQGIPATFFFCGKHVAELPDVVERVRALGHVVANHTRTHADLVATVESGGDVVAEVASTDALIRDGGETVFFRPPYGRWSASVVDALNADQGLAAGYVGPIHWDVDGDDWASWRDGVAPSVCAENYLRATEEVRRGILLMHDSTADHDDWKQNNGAFETIQILVPELQRRGYRFVPLEDIPDVQAALARCG
jgi:peptidoglycan/xylan/chitin deacetylase (PgdA/CDA1 family)